MAVAQPSPNVQGLTAQLSDIADRAVHMTGGNGAAIALQQDGTLVTVASCGESAPDVGVPVRPTSFAGRCFEQGESLVCDDTETDARVDAAGCRVLGVRSMIAVPIRQGKQVLGVLAVFAGEPNRFGRGEVGLARTLATIAGDLVSPAPHAEHPLGKKAAPKTRAESTAAPVSTQPPKTDVTGAAPEKSRTVMHVGAELQSGADTDSLARPVSATLSSNPPTAHAPVPVAAPITEPKPTKIEPSKPVRSVPPPKPKSSADEGALISAAEDPQAAPRPAAQENSAPASILTGYERAAGRKSPMVLIAVAALVLVAVGAGIWIMRGKSTSGDKVLAATATTTSASPETASKKPSVPTAASAETVKPQPVSANVKEMPGKGTSQTAKVVEPVKAALNETKQSNSSAVQPAPQPVLVVRTGSKVAEEEVVAPPSIALPSGSAPPSLGSAKPYVPGAPASELIPPQLMKRVTPVYPAVALARGAQGKVVLNALVLRDGTVGKVTLISGNALLRDAAADAVKRWIYKPASLNGKPTESTVVVEVNFSKGR